MAANNKDVKRGVVIYLDGKEVANNAKAIRAEMKKVREQIDQMTVGSDEYVRATRRYRELDGILQQHRSRLRAVEVQQKFFNPTCDETRFIQGGGRLAQRTEEGLLHGAGHPRAGGLQARGGAQAGA